VSQLEESSLEGRECFAGLDLASTSDFTAWLLVFPRDEGGYDVLARFWIPRATVDKRPDNLRALYAVWEREGWLTVTEGETVEYSEIEAAIGRDAEKFNIVEFGYDPWNATRVVQNLEDAGLVAISVPQTIARLTAGCKEIERCLANRTLRHGGNPILRWMADNVEAVSNGEGQIKPSKKKSKEKIDGIVAMATALSIAVRPREPEKAPAEYVNLSSYM
jgi:phage terminase large subunit-like protein